MQMPISAARTSLSIGITRSDDASIAHSAGTIPKTRIFRSDMAELPFGFRADGGTRTHDPSITNRKLYQLSYIGVAAFFAAAPPVSGGHGKGRRERDAPFPAIAGELTEARSPRGSSRSSA